MKIHSPSMVELHAFVVAARLGSFTRAADQLCVTQGAVSRAVSRLESHFGCLLLHRSPGRLELTPAGATLLAEAADALDTIERVSRELRLPEDPNTLRLSVVPTLASVWLIPRLPEFHRLFPDIKLKFVPYRRDEDFVDDARHAAILSGVPTGHPGWRTDYIIGREVVVICSPQRLAERRAAGQWSRPEELLQETLIAHANAPRNWHHWFRAQGIEVGEIDGPHMDQVSIIVRAVIADMGVAVLQRCLVQEEIDNGRVVVPFDVPVTLEHGYILCCPERYSEHPALVAFRDWLLSSASESALGESIALSGIAAT